MGTFGTKAEEDHIRAACEVKKNSVRSSVIDLWRRLEVGRYVASFEVLTNIENILISFPLVLVIMDPFCSRQP